VSASGIRQANTKRIGDRGELIVLALEKQRLIAVGQPKLADDIDYIAERNDFTFLNIKMITPSPITLTLNLTGQLAIDPQNLEQLSLACKSKRQRKIYHQCNLATAMSRESTAAKKRRKCWVTRRRATLTYFAGAAYSKNSPRRGIAEPSAFIPSLLWLLSRSNGADTLRYSKHAEVTVPSLDDWERE
jgi:hypothetical protein